MESEIARVAELLKEAAETHHHVYRIVDGADERIPPGSRAASFSYTFSTSR